MKLIGDENFFKPTALECISGTEILEKGFYLKTVNKDFLRYNFLMTIA